VPISYTRDDDRRLLRASAAGLLTLGEVLDFVELQHRERLYTWPMLFDTTGATTTAGGDTLRHLVARIRALAASTGPRAPIAIVAPHNLLFGLARMYELLCDATGAGVVEVFRDRAEAEDWLQRLPDAAPR
jgi:hypothetical protein